MGHIETRRDTKLIREVNRRLRDIRGEVLSMPHNPKAVEKMFSSLDPAIGSTYLGLERVVDYLNVRHDFPNHSTPSSDLLASRVDRIFPVVALGEPIKRRYSLKTVGESVIALHGDSALEDTPVVVVGFEGRDKEGTKRVIRLVRRGADEQTLVAQQYTVATVNDVTESLLQFWVFPDPMYDQMTTTSHGELHGYYMGYLQRQSKVR